MKPRGRAELALHYRPCARPKVTSPDAVSEDPRWEALSMGTLTAAEAEALRAEDPERYELYRPFTTEEGERLFAGVQTELWRMREREAAVHEALVRGVEEGRRKLVCEWVLSVAVAFFLSGAGASIVLSHRAPASVVLGVLMLAGAPGLLALFARSQSEVWQADGATTEELFRLELKRREDVQRRSRFVYHVAPPALAVFLVCRWLTFQGGPSLFDLLPAALTGCVCWHARVRHVRAKREGMALFCRWHETMDDGEPDELDDPPCARGSDELDPSADERVLAAIDALERRRKRRWWITAGIAALTAIVMGGVAGLTYEPGGGSERRPPHVGR